MKVLFLVFHPVDPYITFETAKNIELKGGEVFYGIVEKEGIIKKIVDNYKFNNRVIGVSKPTFVGKVLNVISLYIEINKIIKKFKPDIVFSPAGPYTSKALKFSKIPLICWEDTETATFNFKHSHKRIDSLLLTESFYTKLPGNNIIKFNGYKELAYLHPNVFKADEAVIKKIGLTKNDKIVLMRFSALNAMHDIGLNSEVLTSDDKILSFIQKIENNYNAKVFISVTERDLDERFNSYKLKIEPSDYTHLLAFCSLYIGEGTTTASEAGVLGVPWINIQSTKRGYLIDQEDNYGLGFRTENIDYAMEKAEEYLKNDNIRNEWGLKRKKLIEDKIDVSAFLTWFIENYPESHKTLKDNPDYQNKFKFCKIE